MLSKFRSVILYALLLVGSFSAYEFYQRQFRIDTIRLSPLPVSDFLPNEEEDAFLSSLFSQKFHYLDRGKQSFVFISEDGNYILKFFDAHALQKSGDAGRKQERLLEGYRLAYASEREHTGLLYVSLAEDSQLPYTVQLRDRFGMSHRIALKEVPFIVQAKAVPMRILISSLLDKGDCTQAKARFRQIVDLYLDQYQRGIYDDDHNFMYNTGFIGERPIRLDVGRLCQEEAFKKKEIFLSDLKKVAIGRLEGWMQRHFPAYREEIMADMHAKIKEIERTTP